MALFNFRIKFIGPTLSQRHSHQSIAWILQGCFIFSVEDSLPCCLSYHFAFNGRRWPESFWTHSSNWFLGPVEPQIGSYLFIYLFIAVDTLSVFFLPFILSRQMGVVCVYPSFCFFFSIAVLSSGGMRFTVQWKCIFLSPVRIGRAHLASNQCLMVTLGDDMAGLIQSISDWQNRLEPALSVFSASHVGTGVRWIAIKSYTQSDALLFYLYE